MSLKIMLADDHKVLRHGLSQAIEAEEGMEVVGQAENGHEVVELCRKITPDIIIMDISMPSLNGIDATRQILKELPKVKIVALSMNSEKKMIHEMLRAGAKGYLLKDCEYSELVEAIRIVAKDKTYLSPSITGGVIEDFLLKSQVEASGAFAALSDREREVLQLLSEGKTTKQIARVLHVSPKTVEGHRTRIMNKLDIDSIANLTKYAIREGLTSTDQK